MEIRPVRGDEHGHVADLTVEAYRVVLGQDDLREYARELRDVAGRVAGAEVLVAVDGAKVLGGVTYVPGPESPYAEFADLDGAGIRMLAVAPEAQGRGVGEALMRACIERARESGRGQLLLHSTAPMATAHRLYVRLGFERDLSMDLELASGPSLIGFRLKL